MSGVLDVDGMIAVTPDRPTRGGLGSSPMADPMTPEAPKRQVLRRAKAISPNTFGKALAAAGSSSSSTPSPKSKVRAMLKTPVKTPVKKPQSVKKNVKSNSSSSSGKKSQTTPKSNKGGSKSVAKTGKSMKKLSMKCVRKTALKQVKKVAKKTMKKSMKVAKTPKKSKSRSPAYPNPKHFDMIAVKEHDSRDAEGNVNFWSKDNPDKMEELREQEYEAWRDIYDFGSSYIIGGVRVKSDPWPVWFAGALEEAGWVLKANKGRHQRWELEDDS